MNSPPVLVTGASGFVGSHLVDALVARGDRVRVLVRGTSNLRWIEGKPVEIARADLGEAAALKEALRDIRAVFHFGGRISARSEREFMHANADGTENLARAFVESLQVSGRSAGAMPGTEGRSRGVTEGQSGRVRGGADPDDAPVFVFCSSLAAGGPAGTAHPIPFPHVMEEDPPHPVSAYGRSKLEAERRLLPILEGRARLVILRPSAVYGPRDEAVLKFLRIVERGWMPILARRGATFSLIDVGRLVEATLRAFDAQAAQGIYYVSDGLAHTWDDIGALAARVMGVRARRLVVPYPVVWLATLWLEGIARIGGGVPLLSFDKLREMQEGSWVCVPERAQHDFGFRPAIDIERGFEKTVRWYREIGWLHSG